MAEQMAVNILSCDERGLLKSITSLIFNQGGNITYTQQFIIDRGKHKGKADIYMEIEGVAQPHELVGHIRALPAVEQVSIHPPLDQIYGSRVIIIGGGALVAQVALGAVTEADRHNIRGERISVDTIPLVGEQEIANAVGAVSRLHRAQVLVLAGSLMGGRISEEVDRLKEEGVPVIAITMAGSVPEHADLVVTDPIQAGTFAVMHLSKNATFDITRVRGKRF